MQEIRYDDINYLKEMKAAISQGHIVVLVNVKDKLDPELGKFNDLLLGVFYFSYIQSTFDLHR